MPAEQSIDSRELKSGLGVRIDIMVRLYSGDIEIVNIESLFEGKILKDKIYGCHGIYTSAPLRICREEMLINHQSKSSKRDTETQRDRDTERQRRGGGLQKLIRAVMQHHEKAQSISAQ